MTLERKKLRRYSVWEQQEMEDQDINFKCEEDPSRPTVLMLYVSQTSAAAAEQKLRNLCLKQDETTNIGNRNTIRFRLLSKPEHYS